MALDRPFENERDDRTGSEADGIEDDVARSGNGDDRTSSATRRNVLRASAALVGGIGVGSGSASAYRVGSERLVYPSASEERRYEAFYEPRPEFDDLPYEECIPEIGSRVMVKSLAEYGTVGRNPDCVENGAAKNYVRYDVWVGDDYRLGRFWINVNRDIPEKRVEITRVDECGTRGEYDLYQIGFEAV